jgi:hypothetical protein
VERGEGEGDVVHIRYPSSTAKALVCYHGGHSIVSRDSEAINPVIEADFSYLALGTARQQEAYRALQNLNIFNILEPYTPVLAGTIPLGIDVPGSDLDIICEARDLDAFQRVVANAFGAAEAFTIEQKRIGDLPSVVANFYCGYFPVEIFGQARPVNRQNAYRHMIVEARLLEIGGDRARQAIRELKQSGVKTEPAFAQYFNLKGDPYQVLLELSLLNPYELRAVIAGLRQER